MLTFHSNIPLTLRLWFDRRWSALHRRTETQSGLPRCLEAAAAYPDFVRHCPVTMKFVPTLKLLDWSVMPGPSRHWFGAEPVSLATYIAAFLVKLDQGLPTNAQLHRFLVNHPALIWALGFPLKPADTHYGFDPAASLPNHRHFNRVLSHLPDTVLQQLLDRQVTWLQKRWPDSFGQTIALDTKHILAWVKENNRKQYIKEGRFDKTRQPAGDSDCKLGCKRRHNQNTVSITTPTKEGKPAQGLPVSVGEFYWGYASGIVVTKVPGVGEFVLAELTQTFDKGDTTYFFPLMAQVEQRLGFRPRYGALDAGFDAFYIYDYFHSPDHDGFAAVPLSEKAGTPTRRFSPDGLPLCAADLPMPLKFTFRDNTSAIIPYQRAKHVCPLLFPEPNGQSCPIAHKNWAKGGCVTSLANTPGARIRIQLQRDSPQYKQVYDQRTAVERIFSQALALGIERPKLRNQLAIAHQNTLTYLLINLRAMARLLATTPKLEQTSSHK